ncbi:CBS domain-containing protein [Streptomyces sp. NPDC050287]|uniref:CBS domain-containing protein n=1 Tax=Streptomyces sp. NPDC050287 TaxID=3365608 RepID=UPI0037BB04EE
MTCARDLARPYPAVRVDDDAQQAARLMVRERFPALLVLDQVECPYAIVPAAQLLSALVPEDGHQDPLPALISDRFDEALPGTLSGRSVADWLPRRRATPGLVGPEDSPSAVAALMTRKDCPVVGVIERDDGAVTLLRAITDAVLLEHFIGGP